MRIRDLTPLAYCAAALCLLYIAVACEVFRWRNPKANDRVELMHPISVLCFDRLPAYQEHP